jgi:DHA2 family multidrug resistance protein-like MFS transporter
MLAAARVLQGMGAAGIMSVNTALVRFIFPRSLLGRGLGINALIVAVSSAAGPSVAAGILSVGPWPWLFAINVPIGLTALALVGSLPRTPLSSHKFDIASAALNAVTFGLFIAALDGFGHGQPAASVLVELAISIAVGFVFVRRQLRLPAPMLPVDLFRLPIFSLSVATSISCYAAQSLGFIALPFLFQVAGGMSQIDTGLLITPWPLAVVVVAPIAGRLSDRVSAGLLGGIGLAALAAGLVLIATLPAHPGGWNVAWRMALCGAGFGLFQSPNNRQLISAAPRERSGAGSGMLSTSRLLGQTTGGALVAVCFGLAAATGGTVGQGATASITAGAGFAAVAAIVSLLRLTRTAQAS